MLLLLLSSSIVAANWPRKASVHMQDKNFPGCPTHGKGIRESIGVKNKVVRRGNKQMKLEFKERNKFDHRSFNAKYKSRYFEQLKVLEKICCYF